MAIGTTPIRKKGKRCRSDAHRTYFGSTGSLYRARNSADSLYLEVAEIQIHTRMCYSNFNGIIQSINKMLVVLDSNIIWVNPNCGLKTRKFTEVKPTLTCILCAAKLIRAQLAAK